MKATPAIAWSDPADIAYGTALGATQLNAAASVPGTFAYTPPAGTVLGAGANQSLSVVFTPTDTANYTTATASVSINVLPAPATVTLANLSQTYDGTPKSATATTGPAGLSTRITYAGSSTAPTAAGSYSVVATVTDPNYSGSASGTLVVSQATPQISWSTPADITYGTALDGLQLDATASVPGSFVYAPAAGTVLNAGSGQTLSTTFTPSDTTDYSGASASVSLNVLQADTTTAATDAAATTSDSSVTLTASVTSGAASAGTVNEGSVTFVVTDSLGNVVGTAQSGTVASGAASVSYPLPAGISAGTYAISASYSGTNFAPSSGAATLTLSY
jgi:hypothetical protein